MMLLTPAIQEKSGFLAETKAATKIPYSYLIDDETIETKSGHLLQTIKIEGLVAETMDDVLIDHEMQIRNTLLMSLADSSTSLYFHTIRKKETCLLNGKYECAFAERLQTNWNNVLSQKQFYVNAHYITIVKKPPVGKVRQLSDLIKSFSKKFNEEDGKMVGTMQLTFITQMTYQGGKRAQIEGVRVDNNVKGQGIGKAMIEWAINKAKEEGCHLVQLTTDKRRPDALEFYKKLGFVASHEGLKLHF